MTMRSNSSPEADRKEKVRCQEVGFAAKASNGA